VAAVLLADTAHPVEPFYRLVGAVPTIADLVAEFGAARGTPLQYTNIDEQAWREQALAQHWAPHAVEHLSRLWQVFGKAEYRDDTVFRVTGSIEQITGARPETLREFLQAGRGS
jgi:hypothetical protein